MKYQYTTQNQLREAFWYEHPALTYKTGGHNAQDTDTRCAFVDWLDALARASEISEALAQRATL